MKTLLKLLALTSLCSVASHAANVKVSNYNGLAVHGITGSDGARITGGGGYIGRMTVSDDEVRALWEAQDIQGLIAAFEIFDSPAGPFSLSSFGVAGAFEADRAQSTAAGDSDFGGSPVFIWLFDGSNRLSSDSVMIAKLPAVFPTDAPPLPPENITVSLQADAEFFAGSASAITYDYQLGAGAVALLQMEAQDINQPPVAVTSSFTVNRGSVYTGAVTATDDDEDVLSFEADTLPAKGTLNLQSNGSFTYTPDADEIGNDSFTFMAFDGADYSSPATVSITITDLPVGSVAPSIVITELPSGYVGSAYEFQIPIANLPQGQSTAFTAKNLPVGLKLDKKTGVISGRPTKAVAEKGVILEAKNNGGSSGPVEVKITIKAVPEAVVGTFLATIEREADIADGLGGRLNLITTSKGSFTAKLQAGTVAYAAKGSLNIEDQESEVELPPVVSLEIPFAKKNAPTLVASLTLDTSLPAAENFQIKGSLRDGENMAPVSGVRNTWSKTELPEEFVGNYTFYLRLPEDLVGNPAYPQGDGFGALTVTNKGTATLLGKTADGRSFAVPTLVGPSGHLPFFSALTAKTSSLVGTPVIIRPEAPSASSLNSLEGDVSWMKPEADAKSKDRAYKAGFSAFDLDLAGGIYTPPAAGGVVAGLTDHGPMDAQVNAWLEFQGGGLLAEQMPLFGFTIMNKKETGIQQSVIVPKPTPKAPDTNPNPNSVTFKLVSKPAGWFTGTFTLPNEVKANVRKAAYQGAFVRLANGDFVRTGFFLLGELPEAGEKPATTRQLSGLVELLDSAPLEEIP